jgi:hypothetical protein
VSSDDDPRRREAVSRPLLNAFSALVVAAAIAIACYLALRQPQLRQWLMERVPHRYATPMSYQRQLLAPRSVLLAGALVVAAGSVTLLVPRWRRGAMARLGWGDWATAVVFCLGAMLALAPVVNMEAFYLRQFGRPAGVVPREEVLGYLMPQAFPDARTLRARVPANARVAITDYAGDAHNLYLLNALAYPVALYDATDATSGAVDALPSAEFLRRNNIDFVLRYNPKDRTDPLRLREVQ